MHKVPFISFKVNHLNKSSFELDEGTVGSKELIELSKGCIKAILGVSVVSRIGQVLSLVVRSCFEPVH